MSLCIISKSVHGKFNIKYNAVINIIIIIMIILLSAYYYKFIEFNKVR